MDNLSQKNKSVVNPLRRQILLGGVTTPLALTLFAKKVLAQDLTVGSAGGLAPYSGAFNGSLSIDSHSVTDDGKLYKELQDNTIVREESIREYYGTPGTGVITAERSVVTTSEGMTEITTYTYIFTFTWTYGTDVGTGPGTAGTFARRHEASVLFAACEKQLELPSEPQLKDGQSISIELKIITIIELEGLDAEVNNLDGQGVLKLNVMEEQLKNVFLKYETFLEKDENINIVEKNLTITHI